MRTNNCEYRKTWEDIKPGWYTIFIPNYDENIILSDKIKSIIVWIYDHIDLCERHARWYVTGSGINVKFRYERDYIRFSLVWG